MLYCLLLEEHHCVLWCSHHQKKWLRSLGYASELTLVSKLTNWSWKHQQDAFEQRLSVEFRTEVDMLSQVDHLNLVKLIGYLEENHERILVVEYVPNGNLREHLDGTLPTKNIYGFGHIS